MCEIKALPRDTRLAIDEVAKPLRFRSQRPIAQSIVKKFLKNIREMEEDIFSILQQVAFRRGEAPTSYRSVLNRKEIEGQHHLTFSEYSQKAATGPELAGIITSITPYLNQEEIGLLDAAFGRASTRAQGVYDDGMSQMYQNGLNEAYDLIKRNASRQDPEKFNAVPVNYQQDRNSPQYRTFVDNGLDLVKSKITRDFKADAFTIIRDGLNESQSWGAIGSSLHKKIGTAARWHWVRLARTESSIASDMAFQERYEQAGIKFEKFSIADQACPICDPWEGVYNFGEGPRPPLHPNCRCIRIPFYRIPSGAEVREKYNGWDYRNPKPRGRSWNDNGNIQRVESPLSSGTPIGDSIVETGPSAFYGEHGQAMFKRLEKVRDKVGKALLEDGFTVDELIEGTEKYINEITSESEKLNQLIEVAEPGAQLDKLIERLQYLEDEETNSFDELTRLEERRKNAIEKFLPDARKLFINDDKSPINIDRSKLTPGEKKVIGELERIFSNFEADPVAIEDHEGRAYYNYSPEGIHTIFNKKGDAPTLAHEMGHHIEMTNFGLYDLVDEFFRSRTRGKSTAKINTAPGFQNFADHELYFVDSFSDPYIAKAYTPESDGTIATEVTAMFISSLYTPEDNIFTLMDKDPELVKFFFEILTQ